MKRHHIVAVFLLIYGGLFVYLTLDNGEIERAIRMGIFFTLLGVFSFFSGRLQPRLRSLGVTLIILIILGVSAYHDFMAGDYSEFNCTGYSDDFSGSPNVVSRHTIR